MTLKTASDALRELILSSMSTRTTEMLYDDLENMGPVKVADVKGAQQKIIKVVKLDISSSIAESFPSVK